MSLRGLSTIDPTASVTGKASGTEFGFTKKNSNYFKGRNNCINLREMLFPRRKLSYTVVTSGYCRSMISVVSAHLRAPSVPCDNWSGDSEQTSPDVNVSLYHTDTSMIFLRSCFIGTNRFGVVGVGFFRFLLASFWLVWFYWELQPNQPKRSVEVVSTTRTRPIFL